MYQNIRKRIYSHSISKRDFKKRIFRIKFRANNSKRKYYKEGISEYNLADYISVPSEFVKNTFIMHGIDEKNNKNTLWGKFK